MQSYFSQAGSFLISTVFGLYIIAVLLRFLLQWVRADFYHPVSQLLVTLTNPPLIPLRRIIPSVYGLDSASLLLAYLLQLIETTLLLVFNGKSIPLLLLLWFTIGQLLQTILYIFLFAIIIQAVISWINPGQFNPVTQLLYQLTEPVLRPARRILPPFSGLDLSPILVIIAINLLLLLIPFVF